MIAEILSSLVLVLIGTGVLARIATRGLEQAVCFVVTEYRSKRRRQTSSSL